MRAYSWKNWLFAWSCYWPSRSADLVKLDLHGYHYSPEGACSLAKQSRPGRKLAQFFFPRFQENARLCLVTSLQLYIERTAPLRGDSSQLFASYIKPHKPVTSSSIARWLKETISAAGIDTSIFKAHSVRGASASRAAESGISTAEILAAANWSSDSTFRRFYYKPVHNTAFGKAVLLATKTTNNTIDKWDGAFWNIIPEWLRPQSGQMLFCIISWAYQWSHPPTPIPLLLNSHRKEGLHYLVYWFSRYLWYIMTILLCYTKDFNDNRLDI